MTWVEEFSPELSHKEVPQGTWNGMKGRESEWRSGKPGVLFPSGDFFFPEGSLFFL